MYAFVAQVYVPELDRIVLRESSSKRAFGSTTTCRKVGRVQSHDWGGGGVN